MDNKTQVIAAVINQNGKYLLCQRALDDRYGGLWEFPGGKLKSNETFFDAAQRELKEELDVEVITIGELLFAHDDPGSSYVINFYEVEVQGTPIPIEHNAIDWMTKDQLLDYDLAINDRKFSEFLVNTK